MKFETIENIERQERTYTLTISCGEMVEALLFYFDRALIAECDGSDKICDKLLALETIVRRIEEGAATESSSHREGK